MQLNNNIITYVLILFIPGVFWLWFFTGEKRIFKRPLRSLFPCFFMGIFVSIPAIAIEYFCVVVGKLVETQLTVLVTTFFIIAPVEEYLKSLAVDIGGYTNKEKGDGAQILSWYFGAAIGFASIENVLYYWVFGLQVLKFRVVVTTLAHVACSGIVGMFLARGEERSFFQGMSIAILIHGAYDFCLNIYPVSAWFWIPALILLVTFLESRLEALLVLRRRDRNDEEMIDAPQMQ